MFKLRASTIAVTHFHQMCRLQASEAHVGVDNAARLTLLVGWLTDAVAAFLQLVYTI